jgi:AraC family transcriptional regulator, regulatory protein of adaptative response / DNA-3-methyladenine glycosylase II
MPPRTAISCWPRPDARNSPGKDHVRFPPVIGGTAWHDAGVIEDPDRCYQAAHSKDARFDGVFFVGVTSTGIYCRPSCPARTPKRENVRFYASAAAAQQAGFRACLRCRPDATPGSPEWNMRADVVARAMRLIRDGIVDREGVEGLARRLGYSVRQLNRVVTAEIGTGPLAIARAQRSQTARILLETTALPIAHVAFAAGFSSVRQCNETMRQIFADTPRGLRARALGTRAPRRSRGGEEVVSGVRLRLPGRRPFDPESVLAFLGTRAVPGIEACEGATYRRSLRLPHGHAVVALTATDSGLEGPAFVEGDLHLSDLRDLTTAVARCRQLLDLDADPVAILEALGPDPLIGPLVAAQPGLRVPGAVDGFELAVRTVIGQQVSVPGARTIAGRLVQLAGEAIPEPMGGITHLFPSPDALIALAEDDPAAFSMPGNRRRALVALAEAVGSGAVIIDPGTDPSELRAALVGLPGIGPWTAEYVAMRALRDPDAVLPTDTGIRRAARALGQPDDPMHLSALTEAWRPWRSYAMVHLWALPTATPTAATPTTATPTTAAPRTKRSLKGRDAA